MSEHECRGDRFAPTHRCWCDLDRDHSASTHRASIGIPERFQVGVPTEAR